MSALCAGVEPEAATGRSLDSYWAAIANSGLFVDSKSPSEYLTSPNGWKVTRALVW